MKKIILYIVNLSLLFSGLGVVVFAQDADTSPRDSNPRARMDERLNAMQERRDDRQEIMEERQEEMGTRMEERRAAAEQNLEERYQEMRDRFEDRRAAMIQQHEEARERMEIRHEELRQRWEERKAQLSERRKENIKNHIERIIKRMEQAVERLEKLADKIGDRLSKLEQEGVDVAALKVFLGEARGANARADSLLEAAVAELRAAPDTDNPADAIGNARAKLEDVKAALREAHVALVEVVVEIKKGQLMPTKDESDI